MGTVTGSEEATLYIYSYNEDTKLYEYVDSYEDPYLEFDFYTERPVGKYLLSHEMLPDKFITGENINDENTDEVVGDNEPEQKPNNDKKEEIKQEETKKEEAKKEDTTTAKGNIPYAGGTTVIAIMMLLITAIGTIAFVKNRKLKGI